MYPKLGAIPTPTGQEGESGEVDVDEQSEYADEGQQQNHICKRKQSCSVRMIAISMILTISIIVGGVLLCVLLNSGTILHSPEAPKPQKVHEWEALKITFKRHWKTKTLFALLDRYESTTTALYGGNDGGEISRVKLDNDITQLSLGTCTDPEGQAIIQIHQEGWIYSLSVHGLDNDVIVDLSTLPTHLKVLSFPNGQLRHINLSKLPRGLVSLYLVRNRIHEMMLEGAPPTLKFLRLAGNSFALKGITLSPSLPDGLELQVPSFDSVDLNGGECPEWKSSFDEKPRWVSWNDRKQIKIVVEHLQP